MAISPVNTIEPMTCGPKNMLKKNYGVIDPSASFYKEKPEKFEKQTASKGDKVLAGGASFLINGAGQLINGEGKKGAKYFLKGFGFDMLTGTGGIIAICGQSKAGKIVGAGMALAGSVLSIANKVLCVKDAVDNAYKN